MSKYSERLAKLKHEISAITKSRNKSLKPNQKAIVDFVNGVTSKAVMNVKGMTITLEKGDEKKGFMHILLSHYCHGCPGEIKAIDIINMETIVLRGIKLNQTGVSNSNLDVYQYIKGIDQYKLVLKPISNNNFVVTVYKVG